jgi:hypothetical protein
MAAKDKPKPKKGKKPKVPAKPKKDSFVTRAKSLVLRSDDSLRGKFPDTILDTFEVREWKHAGAILATDFPEHFKDILKVLEGLKVRKKHITKGGGGKSDLAKDLDRAFRDLKWTPKRWDTAIVVDKHEKQSPTHEVDCYKDRIALELEWSNKDPFFDRDLNNFRLLFDLRVISLGVIITKSDDLAAVFAELGIWSKYGTTTTWMHKLLPRIEGGGGGGCPLLVIGITRKLYTED